jgi:hypothetical protein
MGSAGVFIVCAPNPRVGVTTLARLLAEWAAFSRRRFAAFDTDPQFAPMCARFPDEARVADLAGVQGQIALFDNLLLADGSVKIVDLWCRSYHAFFDLADEIGFFREAEALGLETHIAFCADPSPVSLAAARDLSARFPQAALLVCADEGAAAFGPQPLDVLAHFPGERGFRLQPLDVALRPAMEEEAALRDLVDGAAEHLPLVVRAKLREWVSRAFVQFRAFDVRRALRDAEFVG